MHAWLCFSWFWSLSVHPLAFFCFKYSNSLVQLAQFCDFMRHMAGNLRWIGMKGWLCLLYKLVSCYTFQRQNKYKPSYQMAWLLQYCRIFGHSKIFDTSFSLHIFLPISHHLSITFVIHSFKKAWIALFSPLTLKYTLLIREVEFYRLIFFSYKKLRWVGL